MTHIVYEYQTMLENYIASRATYTLMLKNIGPKNCTDEAKQTEVYDTYKMFLDKDIMEGLLRSEISCVEFETRDQATKLFEMFPSSPSDGDADYYILAEVYDRTGALELHNR
tara:strand:- start:1035 stop:1370 length:336 start_codon:yes stop_codon:yes gene_type:complete